MGITPLLFDALLRFNVSDGLDLYAIGGLGVVFVSIDDVSGTTSGVPYSVSVDADDAFAAKVGGGADWFVTEDWIANFEASYVFARSDITATATVGGASVAAQLDDVELDYWQIGGGIKYLFN